VRAINSVTLSSSRTPFVVKGATSAFARPITSLHLITGRPISSTPSINILRSELVNPEEGKYASAILLNWPTPELHALVFGAAIFSTVITRFNSSPLSTQF